MTKYQLRLILCTFDLFNGLHCLLQFALFFKSTQNRGDCTKYAVEVGMKKDYGLEAQRRQIGCGLMGHSCNIINPITIIRSPDIVIRDKINGTPPIQFISNDNIGNEIPSKCRSIEDEYYLPINFWSVAYEEEPNIG